MTKATYHAPKDDSPVVHMRGIRFIDGDPVKLGDEHETLIAKLRTNPLFEVTGEAKKADNSDRMAAAREAKAKKAAEAAEAAEAVQDEPEPTEDFGHSEGE